MFRIMGVIWLMLGLAGCAATDSRAWWREVAGLGPAFGQYRFDWQLSGDPDLAPLQVFDDGEDTWLQYPAGLAVPALFARTPAGDRLLRARREGDYLVVRGVPDHLIMRGGLRQAEARRSGGSAGSVRVPVQAVGPAVPAPIASPGPAPVALPGPAPAPVPAVGPAARASVSGRSTAALTRHAIRAPQPVPRPPQITDARPASDARPAPASFEVTPADGNVRKALARWAGLAGWAFDPEHWAVDVDIPVAGSALFPAPFRSAVRNLLAATELGDRPVQPCFYANRVLRVVPLAQRCDRTQQPGGAS